MQQRLGWATALGAEQGPEPEAEQTGHVNHAQTATPNASAGDEDEEEDEEEEEEEEQEEEEEAEEEAEEAEAEVMERRTTHRAAAAAG